MFELYLSRQCAVRWCKWVGQSFRGRNVAGWENCLRIECKGRPIEWSFYKPEHLPCPGCLRLWTIASQCYFWHGEHLSVGRSTCLTFICIAQQDIILERQDILSYDEGGWSRSAWSFCYSLFNASLRLRQVPNEWRKAIIKPIFKGGKKDRRDPSSYRPISLTFCVARTIEKLHNARIFEFKQNLLLYQHPSGFQQNHATVTQLCFLVHQWHMALEEGANVQSIFLDLSKAYDRISINALKSKLSLIGFNYSAFENGSPSFSNEGNNVFNWTVRHPNGKFQSQEYPKFLDQCCFSFS